MAALSERGNPLLAHSLVSLWPRCFHLYAMSAPLFSKPSALQPASSSSDETDEPIVNVPPQERITLHEFYDLLQDAQRFCVEKKLLPDLNRVFKCTTCFAQMKPKAGKPNIYECTARTRCCSVSMKKGTVFEGSHLSTERVLELFYFFTLEFTYDQAIQLSIRSDTMYTRETIHRWYRVCRENVKRWMDISYFENPIGGPGTSVQIDESKVGHWKYNRGSWIDGHCVFGAIEEGTRKIRILACPGNKRDRGTLEPIIHEYLAAGTRVVSDQWKAYDWIGVTPTYSHDTVNHSVEFVHYNPDGSNINTNLIESTWRPMKDFFRKPKVGGEDFLLHLKRKNLFNSLMAIFAFFYKPELMKPIYEGPASSIDLPE